jgi:DNA-binding transcriptional LysR family regulator
MFCTPRRKKEKNFAVDPLCMPHGRTALCGQNRVGNGLGSRKLLKWSLALGAVEAPPRRPRGQVEAVRPCDKGQEHTRHTVDALHVLSYCRSCRTGGVPGPRERSIEQASTARGALLAVLTRLGVAIPGCSVGGRHGRGEVSEEKCDGSAPRRHSNEPCLYVGRIERNSDRILRERAWNV